MMDERGEGGREVHVGREEGWMDGWEAAREEGWEGEEGKKGMQGGRNDGRGR